MARRSAPALITTSLLLLAACSGPTKPAAEAVPNDTEAPETFHVRLETSKGPIVVECTRAWAPKGADRFYMLAKRGFYNDARFFRVVPGFVVQFGMNGNPEENAKWSNLTIMDDPVRQPNLRGSLAFAAESSPNTRSTQIFINLADNSSKLDPRGFTVFGRVTEGLDLIDKINPEYGEKPDQGMISARGNAYLGEQFPRLDYIQKVTITQ